MDHPKNLSIVVSCIDYRFWPKALPLLKEKYGDFDLIEIAGSSKNLTSPAETEDETALLENIGISMRLHNPYRIILTNHMDCGAYGGSRRFESKEQEIAFHVGELAEAREVVGKAYPSLVVETEFILMGENGEISLLKQ